MMKTSRGHLPSRALLAALVWLASLATIAATLPSVPIERQSPLPAKYAAYDTALFNLMINRANIIDGKLRYDPALDRAVASLLSTSAFLREHPKVPPALLKKRLLSGPAPAPLLISLPSTHAAYIVYTTCQAHACDATNLVLLFDPELKRVLARLQVDGHSELLGKPSASEMMLLNAGDQAP